MSNVMLLLYNSMKKTTMKNYYLENPRKVTSVIAKQYAIERVQVIYDNKKRLSSYKKSI